MPSATIHEDFGLTPELTLSADRTFGLVWTAFLVLYGLAPLRRAAGIRVWPMGFACVILVLSIFLPKSLHRLNLLWAKVALLLHRIVSPIIMGVIFYGCFVPVGLLARIRRKDPLHLRFNRSASTYWITRTPPGQPPEEMINQF